MKFTGQKAEQPASTACLLARKCNRLARKMAANMRNAICVRTQTSKVPTQDILLVSSLFCVPGVFNTRGYFPPITNGALLWYILTLHIIIRAVNSVLLVCIMGIE